MALSEKQAKALRAKLRHQHVKTRESHGMTVAYVEGWHVIAEANRIFGFENWDRQTQTPECLWSENQRGQTVCFYSAKVRITVRSGDTAHGARGHRHGSRPIATGRGRPRNRGQGCGDRCHEASVGHLWQSLRPGPLRSRPDPCHQAAREACASLLAAPDHSFTLVLADERTLGADGPRRLCRSDATRVVEARHPGGNLRVLDAQTLPRSPMRPGSMTTVQVPPLLSALKDRLREIGRAQSRRPANGRADLLIPKETRIRDRDHLAFVARQPCLVCGRRPAQAHHLKFAQPRSMSLKVSDEYTVPLCNGHHDALHKSGDERAWWARHGIIDPLKFAARLWAASRNGERETYTETAEERAEPILRD